ncbi:hypothetical protein AKJ09_04532 [Labilithrix luteola]|uniref:Uncharacterized protein n=1 Tax=Labilithrix luteola TaxID=1391654 RepID=A0A0K1PWG5_9BACT|nr:hypothetical protein AKJ09_04532 [Labilithrix luteola]
MFCSGHDRRADVSGLAVRHRHDSNSRLSTILERCFVLVPDALAIRRR